VALAIVLQRLYVKSGSIWAVALAHGAMNTTALFGMAVLLQDDRLSRLIHGPTGVVGLLVIAPVAVWLWFAKSPPHPPRWGAALSPSGSH
jgi:hypothetical protein